MIWETISHADFATSTCTQYDLIVNMSGATLPSNIGVPVENWDVEDPYGGSEDDFRAAREVIEMAGDAPYPAGADRQIIDVY